MNLSIEKVSGLKIEWRMFLMQLPMVSEEHFVESIEA